MSEEITKIKTIHTQPVITQKRLLLILEQNFKYWFLQVVLILITLLRVRRFEQVSYSTAFVAHFLRLFFAYSSHTEGMYVIVLQILVEQILYVSATPMIFK